LPEYGLPDPIEYEKLNLPILLIIGANDKLRERALGAAPLNSSVSEHERRRANRRAGRRRSSHQRR